MIIIKFFPSAYYGCDLPNYGKDFIITDGDNYTHAILLWPGKTRPNLKINKKNVVAMTPEAPKYVTFEFNLNTNQNAFFEYCKRYIGTFLIGGVKNTAIPNKPPFLGFYCSRTSGKIPRNISFNKTKKMSIMISAKSFQGLWVGKAYGYSLRKQIVLNILKSNFPIDIWGNGCSYLNSSDTRIKGPFKSDEPYKNYQFTIAIENMKYPHYITEKFETALKYQTIPIYWGAKYIEYYYPNCCIQLSGNIKSDILLIKDILQNSQKYFKNMEKAQKKLYVDNNLVKRCVNIWKNS